MKFTDSKKSFMGVGEIFGIAFIVFIIFIGFGAFVRFGIFQPRESPQKTYITGQFANDVIDVLIRTNSNCKDLPIKDLIQDCERATYTDTIIDDAIGCNSPNEPPRSCQHAKFTIDYLLKKHLQDREGIDYYFVIFRGNIDEGKGEVLKWTEGTGINQKDVKFKIGSLDSDKNGEPDQCPSSKRSKTYQLPSTSGSGGSIFLKLDICI